MTRLDRLCVAAFAVFAGLQATVADPRPAVAQSNRIIDDLKAEGSAAYKLAVGRFLNRDRSKIVGGQEAANHAFPWQVSIGASWIVDPTWAHYCGGSVYNETWIVTAAHCIDGDRPENVSVTAGSNVLDSAAIRRNVKRIVVKSDYDATTVDNDIGLLELWDPLPLTQNLAKIPLVTAAEAARLEKEDVDLSVTGWGHTQLGGQNVSSLRFVTVPLVGKDRCNAPLSYGGKITENMLCAGLDEGNKDSCKNDSGGGASLSDGGVAKLAGIVSWGEGCGLPLKYGVYTRVSKYAAWVEACVAKPDECR
jgi:secreted trypsin-like serine protease